MFLFYNLLLLALSPLILLYLAYRILVLRKGREGLPDRLGFPPRLDPPPAAGRVWIQAASAGEAVAASTIARALKLEHPGVEVVISTTTAAGRIQAERLIPWARCHCYFPFDFAPSVLSAFARLQPTAVATIETEIWPNWFVLAGVRGCGSAILNGQLTDRGFRRALPFRPIYAWCLSKIDSIRVQTQEVRQRFLQLGAPAERVAISGSVKFDQEAATPSPELKQLVLHSLCGDEFSPLLLAASTHPGEEEELVREWRIEREAGRRYPLLIAPRHIERSRELLQLLTATGARCALRSSEPAGPLDAMVLDTMGELAGLYELAHFVFSGGSLAPIGGHDIIQPLLAGKPLFFGPYMQNQRETAAVVLAAGAAVQVETAEDLFRRIEALLSSSSAESDLQDRIERLLSENRGAAADSARLLAFLAARTPSGSGS